MPVRNDVVFFVTGMVVGVLFGVGVETFFAVLFMANYVIGFFVCFVLRDAVFSEVGATR